MLGCRLLKSSLGIFRDLAGWLLCGYLQNILCSRNRSRTLPNVMLNEHEDDDLDTSKSTCQEVVEHDGRSTACGCENGFTAGKLKYRLLC